MPSQAPWLAVFLRNLQPSRRQIRWLRAVFRVGSDPTAVTNPKPDPADSGWINLVDAVCMPP